MKLLILIRVFVVEFCYNLATILATITEEYIYYQNEYTSRYHFLN